MTKMITDQAILFRLYCERSPDEVQGFADDLAKMLGLVATNQENSWLHPQDEVQVRWLDPYLNDTLMIEVVWNSAGEAEFWRVASNKIHFAVKELETECCDLEIRGMTMIFQACVEPNIKINDIHPDEVMESSGLSYQHPNLSQDTQCGRFWLLGIPHDEQNEIIYLALCGSDQEEALAEALYSEMFILKDIISHKAFQCRRSVKRIVAKFNPDDLVYRLTMSTEGLLDEEDVLSIEQDHRLANLAKDYDNLLDVSLALEIQRTSLAQQEWNFNSLTEGKTAGDIDQYLYHRIMGFHQEVVLKSDQCHRVLDGAEKATNIARTRIEEIREIRRSRQEVLIAFLGILLALPELLQLETLERVLIHWGIVLSSPMIFLIQILIVLIAASGLATIVWIAGRIRRGKCRGNKG